MSLLTPEAEAAIKAGIPPEELFTPLIPSGERLVMRVKNRPTKKGRGYLGQVRDELTMKRYKVYGWACGLPKCFCDAMAVEIVPQMMTEMAIREKLIPRKEVK